VSILEIVAVAVGLAMDAFAVSLAAAAGGWVTDRRARFRLWWHFGLFQALMPVIGWAAGARVNRWVAGWDHWLVFLLLAWIGGRMIRNAWRQADAPRDRAADPTRGRNLVGLSVATSLDALAVGFSFALLGVTVWRPALIIGVVAALFSLAGCLLGGQLGRRLGSRMEALGGLVLVFIGLRVLLQDLLG
jgi:putative Mn2+ efflux pump MntP